MERLTYWNCKSKNSALPVGINDMGDTVCLEDLCAKLAAYEDAEEQGLLAWLPCRVGDTVFTIRWNVKNGKYEVYTGEVKNVRCDTCDGIVSVSDGDSFHVFGKTIFLNREEAEAALKAKGLKS